VKPTILPTRIDINPTQGYMDIEWSDGSVGQYPLANLREACPCVECRGGHANMGYVPPDLMALVPARPYGFEQPPQQVGTYGLQFFWDDGHHTGIYTWDYLYKLRPKN
jgi:DUF971 family protein